MAVHIHAVSFDVELQSRHTAARSVVVPHGVLLAGSAAIGISIDTVVAPDIALVAVAVQVHEVPADADAIVG